MKRAVWSPWAAWLLLQAVCSSRCAPACCSSAAFHRIRCTRRGSALLHVPWRRLPCCCTQGPSQSRNYLPCLLFAPSTVDAGPWHESRDQASCCRVGAAHGRLRPLWTATPPPADQTRIDTYTSTRITNLLCVKVSACTCPGSCPRERRARGRRRAGSALIVERRRSRGSRPRAQPARPRSRRLACRPCLVDHPPRPVVAPPRRLERKTPLTPDALLQPARRAAPSAGPCVRRLLRKKKQKGNQNSNPKSNGN